MLKGLLEKLLHGAFLDGYKKLIGIAMYFLPMWFPGVPASELQVFLQQLGQVFIAWGVLSDGYKKAKGK